MLNIRLAVPEDAETLVRLNTAFNGLVDEMPEDVRRSLMNSPEIVVVAEVDGETAAFCCAQVHHSFCYQAPVAEVTEMYVDEAYRRRGCATGMLAFLEKHLRSRWGGGRNPPADRRGKLRRAIRLQKGGVPRPKRSLHDERCGVKSLTSPGFAGIMNRQYWMSMRLGEPGRFCIAGAEVSPGMPQIERSKDNG